MGTFVALAVVTFFGLAGDALGFGAFTVLDTTLGSLATVLEAPFALEGASFGGSSVFFAFTFFAAGAALPLAVSLEMGSFAFFPVFSDAAFLTGLGLGAFSVLAFFVVALALVVTGFAASVFSSISAT